MFQKLNRFSLHFFLNMSRIFISSFLQQYQDTLKQLLANINDSSCALWNELINSLKQNQQIICPKKGMKSTTVQINFGKTTNMNLSTSPHNIIYSIRYGDFRIYEWMQSMDDLSTITQRKHILYYIACNMLIMKQSLTENAKISYGKLEKVDPRLLTVLLVESICNHKKTDNMQSVVESIFIDLVLLHNAFQKDQGRLLCLAALMVFRSDDISRYLQETKVSTLWDILKEKRKDWKRTMIDIESGDWNIDIQGISKKLKKWQFNVGQIGKHFFYSLKKDLSEYDRNCLILIGKLCVNYNEYKSGISWYVASICCSYSLYIRILSMRHLSIFCKDNGQYLMALKLLNAAYKYCNLYEFVITPCFVNKIYFEKKKKIKKKLNKMVCIYCNKKGKLKCCTGCMVATYCNKICQKRHWKSIHHKECDKSWLEYYKKLKDELVFNAIK